MQIIAGRSYRLLLVLIGGLALFCNKMNDQQALQQALDLKDPQQRVTALRQFVNDFPDSKNIKRACQHIFRNEAALGHGEEALQAAAEYLALIPENARMQDYNSIAWTLAEKNLGVDSAVVYAERAVELGRAANYRRLGMILDTYAYALFKSGKAAEAEKIQDEAMNGNEDDNEFIYHLAIYQHANNKRVEALNNMARAILLGAEASSSLELFNNWLAEEKPQIEERRALAKQIVEQTVSAFLKQSDTPASRSQAAMMLAQTGIDMERAEKWARAAVQALDKNASANDQIILNKNLALICKAKNDYAGMIQILEPWRQMAMPYDQDYWLNLALAYKETGQKENSLKAAVAGLVADSDDELLALAESQGYSETEINALTEKWKQELMAFNPGRHTANISPAQRVTLVELFTGADCPPCVGADKALDLLAEYHPRESLAVLEYHLHIPGPDPLTNDYSEARYKFYGQNFGTPNVYFNGLPQNDGGGPELIKKCYFFRYNQVVERYNASPAEFALALNTERQEPLIKVNVSVSARAESGKSDLNLYIALVENSVNYTGANGLSRHAFVVRYLVNKAAGIPVIFARGKCNVEETIDLRNVNEELSKYLDDFAKNPPERYKNFSGWNVRPDKINPMNLAVAAWIQDQAGKEIYQACYQELK